MICFIHFKILIYTMGKNLLVEYISWHLQLPFSSPLSQLLHLFPLPKFTTCAISSCSQLYSLLRSQIYNQSPMSHPREFLVACRWFMVTFLHYGKYICSFRKNINGNVHMGFRTSCEKMKEYNGCIILHLS